MVLEFERLKFETVDPMVPTCVAGKFKVADELTSVADVEIKVAVIGVVSLTLLSQLILRLALLAPVVAE